MNLPQHAVTHNVAEIVSHPEHSEPVLCRIPDSVRLALNEKAQLRALESAGCELRFRVTSPSLTIGVRACSVVARHHGGGLAQVLCGDFSKTYFPVTADGATCELELPDFALLEAAAGPQPAFHPRLVRLLLPTHASICGLSVTGDLAPPEPGDTPAKRLLVYGSSITQGSAAVACRESWAGRTAHNLGADLINLGFGGACHCEPEMTDYLCERKGFDMAILETGINMLGHDPELTDARIERLIRDFSAAHPDIPVFCVGVYPCRNDITTHFAGRAQEIRELVARTVSEVNSPNLHFIDGREALDPALGLTVDLTHPSPSGMVQIAEFLTRNIRAIVSA